MTGVSILWAMVLKDGLVLSLLFILLIASLIVRLVVACGSLNDKLGDEPSGSLLEKVTD